MPGKIRNIYTIKCIGYRGHKCGKLFRRTGRRQSKCSKCAVNSEIERLRKRNSSLKERVRKTELRWRIYGIILNSGAFLTWARFQRDLKKGCGLKFLGNCAGLMGADHDHETGLYRGPLCLNHNHALGKLGDSPKSLKRIIQILEAK